jgi:hypothetical protein
MVWRSRQLSFDGFPTARHHRIALPASRDRALENERRPANVTQVMPVKARRRGERGHPTTHTSHFCDACRAEMEYRSMLHTRMVSAIEYGCTVLG